ncbi:MAG: hypothetical protein AAFV01_09715 [Bacteroidota bacterium]
MTEVEKIAAGLAALVTLGDTLDGLLERIQGIEEDARALAVAAAISEAAGIGLHPDHAYLPKRAAQFLGIKPTSLYSGKYRTLPRGTSGSILGIWIMAANGTITHEEAQAYVEVRRAAVLYWIEEKSLLQPLGYLKKEMPNTL